MKLNIIYTPGSVLSLGYFALSFLEYSDFSLRLVSNGCSKAELEYLNKIATKSNRISVFVFPSKNMLLHGEVLDLLQQINKDRYFCFCDSDIFTNAALPSFEKIMTEINLGALFTGLPIWLNDADRVTKPEYDIFFGTNDILEGRGSIGNSYFAIYDNKALNSILDHYEVGFLKATWEQLSDSAKNRIEGTGLKRKLYDTGKVINTLMITEKMKLENMDLESLIHIGGFSIAVNMRDKRTTRKTVLRLTKSLCTPEEYHNKIKLREQYKIPVVNYFLSLIKALSNSVETPNLPELDNEKILSELSKAKISLIELFHKYGRAK